MNIELRFILICAAVVLLLLPVIFYKIRKQYAKRKVTGRSTEEKAAALNKDLEPFGFAYDVNQDMVYSVMDSWQREMGYCRLYDEAALAFNMAIHSEPILFRYNNRRWLIEFWKGQYGMTTGGEIGIYVTDKEDISVPGVFEGPFFECVSDEERILMQYVLYKDRQPVLYRRELHWWLTGFDVGRFTNPNRLSMDIRLTFPNRTMLQAFVKGLEEAGYEEDSYQVLRNTVQIYFGNPKSKQPHRKMRILYYTVQWLNRLYCGIFRRVTEDYVKTLDKLDYLRFLFPWLYRIVTGFAKPKKIQKVFQKLKKKTKEREVV